MDLYTVEYNKLYIAGKICSWITHGLQFEERRIGFAQLIGFHRTKEVIF